MLAISASAAEATTFLIVEHMTCIGALDLMDADGLLVKTNHPAARDLASG